eukprot:SAG22_NODE_213_length_15041_cov_3.683732_12_plen_79_part_00
MKFGDYATVLLISAIVLKFVRMTLYAQTILLVAFPWCMLKVLFEEGDTISRYARDGGSGQDYNQAPHVSTLHCALWRR